MLWNRALRSAAVGAVLAVCGALALSACAAHYAQVPPRLSLRPYGRVALVSFSTEGTNGELSTAATRRFAEALLASQSGVELLELTGADSSLRTLAAAGDASALAQALGREKNVPAVFLGQLKLSGVKPRGRAGRRGTAQHEGVGVGGTDRASRVHEHRRHGLALELGRGRDGREGRDLE